MHSSPRPFPISVEVGGKTYHGSYTVEQGMITVHSAGGMKTTQVGSMPVDVLARMLLHELIGQGKA